MKSNFLRRNLLPFAAIITTGVVLAFFSCQKTGSTNPPIANSELNGQFMSSTNFAYLNETLDDEDFSDAFYDAAGSIDGRHAPDGGCKTITYDPSKDVYPHTKTVVFNNCQGECRGGTVNGTKITYNYIDPELAQPGDLIKETTYEGLSVDSMKIGGDVKVYFVSDNPRTLHIVTTRTFVIPGADGITETSHGDYTRTQTEGGNTQDHSDDVFAVTGSSRGNENAHGGPVAKYTAVINADDPLIRAIGCCWRTEGSETITLDVKSHGDAWTLTEVLDYGDGTCDDQATLTINGGEAQAVTLPLVFWPLTP